MANLNGLSGVPLQFNGQFNSSQGMQYLEGSFQGNAASAPTAAQNRGEWFTVAHQATGQYRVTLNGIHPNNALVPTQSAGNGQPNGLMSEPFAWLNSESTHTAASTLFVSCSKFDTSAGATNNTFDIFVNQLGQTGSGSTPVTVTATDLTSADRCTFRIGWKVLAVLP